MKIFRIIGFALMAVLMCVACNNGFDEPQLEVEAGKTYEVSLSLGGDYIDVSEIPLSRADEPKKYYAINVLCMKTDGSENSYSFYASGVFDNINDMKITLLGGYKYKFECTSATEGEEKFFTKNNYLYWPTIYDQVSISNINKFNIPGNGNYVPEYNLKYGSLLYNITNYDNYYHDYPKMDRYYGELLDYVPTEGGTATISMKRCVFGVKIIINGVPDGTLGWSSPSYYVKNDKTYYMYLPKSSHTGNEKLEFSSIYTFYNVYDCWEKTVAGDDYTQTFTIGFGWERSNGYTQSFSKEFTVKRNVMTTINVTLTGGSEEIGVGINEETSEMTNESVDMNLDGGLLNDTEVNPVE